jgi:FK506-binding protein 4/5
LLKIEDQRCLKYFCFCFSFFEFEFVFTNVLFQEGKYKSALKKYKKIIEYLKDEVFDTDDEKEEASKLKLAAQLNISMCHLKLKEYRSTIDTCIEILDIDPKNEKAIFRMAQGYAGLNEYKDAIHYYSLVVEVNPNNRDASQQIASCKQKLKEYNDKQKSIYSKMFK